MEHTDVWRAIDTIAAKNGLTPSGLAIRCGLCSTAFNKSKRYSSANKPRWPTMQSIAKILDTLNQPMSYFADILDTIVAERRAVQRAQPRAGDKH